MTAAFGAIATMLLVLAASFALVALRQRARLRLFETKYAPILDVEAERARIGREAEDLRAQSERTRRDVERERAELQASVARDRQAFAEETSAARAKWEKEFSVAVAELERLTKEVEVLATQADLQSFGLYKNKFDFASSDDYQRRLDEVVARQEALIKSKSAATCPADWTIDGSKAKGRQMVERYLKLMLRGFNGEADAVIARVKYNNAAAMEQRLERSYEAINKLGESVHCAISQQYFQLRLDELRLTFEYQQKLQAEKEEQRAIREQMREEELALKEIERAQKEAEKDEEKFEVAVAKAKEALEQASQKEKEKYEAKLAELERKLAEAHAKKEKALSMAQLTKAGHVYVISNVGAFGEHVYKVGMTRRLEPMDRVRELGDASVPFQFDVHAMIFSEDAPALESSIHKLLDDRRVNLVNDRKEFFRVTLHDLESTVRRFAGANITFTHAAAAAEFRQSLALVEEREAQLRHSQPPSPAKELVNGAKADFEKLRASLGAVS